MRASSGGCGTPRSPEGVCPKLSVSFAQRKLAPSGGGGPRAAGTIAIAPFRDGVPHDPHSFDIDILYVKTASLSGERS